MPGAADVMRQRSGFRRETSKLEPSNVAVSEVDEFSVMTN
jgi:hypothetical protein